MLSYLATNIRRQHSHDTIRVVYGAHDDIDLPIGHVNFWSMRQHSDAFPSIPMENSVCTLCVFCIIHTIFRVALVPLCCTVHTNGQRDSAIPTIPLATDDMVFHFVPHSQANFFQNNTHILRPFFVSCTRTYTISLCGSPVYSVCAVFCCVVLCCVVLCVVCNFREDEMASHYTT